MTINSLTHNQFLPAKRNSVPGQTSSRAGRQPPTDQSTLSSLPALETPKKAIRKIVEDLGYAEFPQVSPDGKTLVFNVVGDYSTSQLMTVPVAGGKVKALDSGQVLTEDNVEDYLQSHQGSIREQATFDKNGNLLFRTNQNGTFDIGGYNFSEKTFKMVVQDSNLNLKHPVELANGQIALYGGPPTPERPTSEHYSNLYLADPGARAMKQLTFSNGEYAYKHPAPIDGKLVAHREDKSRNGISDLVVLDPVSQTEEQLTYTPTADEKHAFYNKNVDLLVYHRKENGDKNLVLSTPDGSRTAQLTFYGRPAQSPCWSPDGKEIYFIKKDVRQPDGEPFYNREADVRAINVKKALKELTKQAQKRLSDLGDSEQADQARLELENYQYFLRRY